MFVVGLDVIMEFFLGSYKYYLGVFGGVRGVLVVYMDK